MERKLVRNKTEFTELCKHWREVERYENIQEDYIAHPSEYPCMVLIEEQISKHGSDSCNFHYVYISDFNEKESEDEIIELKKQIQQIQKELIEIRKELNNKENIHRKFGGHGPCRPKL